MLLDTRNKRVTTIYIYIYTYVCVQFPSFLGWREIPQLVRLLIIGSFLSPSRLRCLNSRLANSRECAALHNCDALARESRAERERERDLETLLSPRVRSLDLYTRALARALGLHLCARVLDASHPHCDIFPACLYLFAKLPLPLPLFLIPAHSKISRERKFLLENRTKIIIPSTILVFFSIFERIWTVNREGVNERENYSRHVLFLETI